MIDSYWRAPYQKLIDPIAKKCSASPNRVTLAAFITGLLCAPALWLQCNILALFFLLLSGFLDTLDGSIARMQNKTSNLGSAFDIFSDRCVESAVLLGLYLRASDFAFTVIAMLISSFICVTSFLVVGIFSQNETDKSFHYSPGMIERGEAFCFFATIILFPSIQVFLGSLYAVLVFLTGLRRMIAFRSHST